jgi:hypothetical protein
MTGETKRTGLMRNSILLSVLISAAALAGCKTEPGYIPPVDPYYPPISEPVAATADAIAIDTALQVCEVDSLRAQRDERIESARALLITGYASGGDVNERWEDSEGTLRVDQPPSGPQTERTEMLRAFELDLDAAYRFAAGSCRAYSACMHQRDYEERDCVASLNSWERAQDRFTDVSLSLAEIRADIAAPARHHHAYGRDRYDRRHARPRRDRDCEGVIADLFTTDACDHQR